MCISPQFRAIDPPNPARGFIQQNENVRFATAACMQKYGNVSFATVACAKCMRYGGRGGGTHTMGGGGVATRDTEPYIYAFFLVYTMIFLIFQYIKIEQKYISRRFGGSSTWRYREINGFFGHSPCSFPSLSETALGTHWRNWNWKSCTGIGSHALYFQLGRIPFPARVSMEVSN